MLCGAVWAQAPSPAPGTPRPAQQQPGTPKPEAAPLPEVAPGTVVFSVGATKMTKAQFDDFIKDLPDNLKTQLNANNPEARRRFATQLADLIGFAEAARNLKLNDKPAVKVQTFLQTETVLAAALYQHFVDTGKPTEAQEKAYYDEHKSEYESAKARHILIRFQGSRVPVKPGTKDLSDAEALAKAQQVRERIAKGEDFAVVAKAESDDTGSATQGGSLGSFTRGRMVPVFEEAAFSLPVGELSQPVKSPFGYHIIQVEERSVKPFESVQADIEKKLQTEAAQKAMEKVKDSLKSELDPAYFGPAPTAAPPTPAAK